jgi:hypothetical protein
VQGGIAVRFAGGTRDFCTVFDGAALRRDVAGKFVTAHAAAPTACPVTPFFCP